MVWSLRRRLAQVHNWIFERRKISTTAMLVLVILYAGLELGTQWWHWAQVNWMILTGLPVGLLFIWQTNDIRARFEQMADDLSEHDFLRFTSPGHGPGERVFVEDATRRADLRNAAKRQVEEEAAVWGFGISLIFVPLCILVLHLISHEASAPMKLLLYLIVVLMACACGLRIGRMACYGWQGRNYRTMEIKGCLITIVPKLGHPDGSAGLAPIGRFYNHQVGTMSCLIGFLLIWLIILWLFQNQSFVQNHYPPETSLGLLALFALIFTQQILGFFLPMATIHKELGRWKERAIQSNFEAVKQIEACQHEGAASEDSGLVLRKLDLRHQRDDIAAMGLWPVSMETLRQFWLGKAGSVSIALLAGYNDITDFFAKALQQVQY